MSVSADCQTYLNVIIPAMTDEAVFSDLLRCCDKSIPLTICDDKSNIIKLNLNGYPNFLVGRIDPAIGNLKNLEVLFLYNNSLTGTIPTTVSQLTKLRVADLSQNKFTGQLPASLANLPKRETTGSTQAPTTGTTTGATPGTTSAPSAQKTGTVTGPNNSAFGVAIDSLWVSLLLFIL